MSTVSFPKIGLKPTQARAAARRAKQAGKTPTEYLRCLVERDLLAGGSFDDVLRPVRSAFARSGMGEDELNQIVTRARRTIHGRVRRRARK
jgi:hypothetical protein